MTAWIGKLFGTDKAVDNLLDKDSGLLAKAGAWVGNFNYTDEEKAEADAQTREWGIRQLDALAPFKVMQRIMVTIIMSIWALLSVVMIVAICFDAIEIMKNTLLFIQTPFIWAPISGAVSLYLLGGVMPSRGK
jgi:hypothetical protein